jgi:hypothetical protein
MTLNLKRFSSLYQTNTLKVSWLTANSVERQRLQIRSNRILRRYCKLVVNPKCQLEMSSYFKKKNNHLFHLEIVFSTKAPVTLP